MNFFLQCFEVVLLVINNETAVFHCLWTVNGFDKRFNIVFRGIIVVWCVVLKQWLDDFKFKIF